MKLYLLVSALFPHVYSSYCLVFFYLFFYFSLKDSLCICCMAGLLATNSPCFCFFSFILNFSFIFKVQFFWIRNTWLTVFSFQHFEHVIPLPFGLHSSWWKVSCQSHWGSFVCEEPFFSFCFKDSVFGFIQFDYHVFQCGSLCAYCTYNVLSLLYLECAYLSNLGNFKWLFLQILWTYL